jgi:hypothetical protein
MRTATRPDGRTRTGVSTMTDFTPGPWFVRPTPEPPFGTAWREIGPAVVVATGFQRNRDGESWTEYGVQLSEANATLIAQAPALYEALDKALEALIWCSGSDDFAPEGKAAVGWETFARPIVNQAIDVLAAARGDA